MLCTNGEASRIEMDENQTNQEQQLKGLVDERMKEIKSIAQKVCKAIPLLFGLFGVHESTKKVKALEEVGMH
ncbi:unnamed protein product [Camellia sinensis]